jgi:hypothetical protein
MRRHDILGYPIVFDSLMLSAMIRTEPPHNYKCPKLECGAEYFAIHREHPPETKPRCNECGTPFLAMESGQYIHYQPAGTSGANGPLRPI